MSSVQNALKVLFLCARNSCRTQMAETSPACLEGEGNEG